MITVREPIESEYPTLYRIFAQYAPSFWDKVGEAEFIPWFENYAKWPIIGEENGKILAFSFLDHIKEGHFANVVFAKDKSVGDYKPLWDEIKQTGLPYYFRNLDIVKITATVPVQHNACLSFMERMGFSCDGILRKHARINGEWADYFHYCLLREVCYEFFIR